MKKTCQCKKPVVKSGGDYPNPPCYYCGKPILRDDTSYAKGIIKGREMERKRIEKIINDLRWRKTEYGYRQKGGIGTATNGEYCEGQNDMISDIHHKIKED